MRGEVLYVGKARALKNRVTNYTQVTRLTKRLQRMVAQTRDDHRHPNTEVKRDPV